MSRLWTPPRVSREMREEAEGFQAEVRKLAQHQYGVTKYWTERVQVLDPQVQCIFAPPTQRAAELGMVPGRYHWLRRNDPGVPPAIIPIESPEGDGRFCEPTEWHYEQLKAGDLQNAQVVRDRKRAREEAKAAEERAKALESADRWEEIKDRYKAAFETSISMNRSSPWSQNRSGNGRRDAGQRKKKAA